MVQAVSGRNPENFSGFFFGEIFSDFMPSGLEHADVNPKIISVTTTQGQPARNPKGTTMAIERRLRANERNILPLDGARFSATRDEDGGYTMVAEASDFGPARDGLWWLQQIYNDACDVGIAICSHRTGLVIRFRLVEVEENEGDLVSWRFVPLDKREAGRSNGVTEVVIYND